MLFDPVSTLHGEGKVTRHPLPAPLAPAMEER